MKAIQSSVRALGLIGVIILLTIIIISGLPVFGQTTPRTNHHACTAACVLDMNIIHANQGVLSDASKFHNWYNTYWNLTNCGESGWKTDLNFLFSLVSDAMGAPGGVTMQCWQGLMAQAANCSKTCNDYFIKDAAFAPNVRVSLLSMQPGHHQVRVDNNYYSGLPEKDPNAYSRNFYLTSALQLNGGKPLLVDAAYLPSLSFPNWITRNGLRGFSECVNASFNDNRCNLILPLAVTDVVDWSVNYHDGVLYDISGFISNPKGVSGSFTNDGYIVLYSKGDKVTFKKGDYVLVSWKRIYYQDKGPEHHVVEYWNANRGDITIENNECNNRALCGNSILGIQISPPWHDADIYLFAVKGPAELRLPGTYTMTVLADVGHDKDFSNNSISYSYTEQDLGDWQDTSESVDDGTPNIDISTLPIIAIPGDGVFNYTLPNDVPGMMFRLDIPQDVYAMYLDIFPQSTGKVFAYGNIGSIPVPSYPATWSYEYKCMIESVFDGFHNPIRCGAPGNNTFYLFVPGQSTSKSFRIEVEFVTNIAATATKSHQQTRQAEYALTQQALIRTFTEVEPNNSKDTANAWDMIEPFTGELTRGDEDYIFVTFDEPGIYTVGITEISPQMKIFLGFGHYLYSGGFLQTVTSENLGEGVSLSFDASAGESFFFKVLASVYDLDGSFYTLELLDFIPDPDEPNDTKEDATIWDISQGPIAGYFWEKSNRGERADYFRFTAPVTSDGSAVSFSVSNPKPDISICMTLHNQSGYRIHNPPCSDPGQEASLVYTLVPEQEYYIKLFTVENKTSFQPYSLRALYVGDNSETGLTEVEPNNTCDTANPWDMQAPFKGVFSTPSDEDYILISIPTPGIYTFSITDVSPNLSLGLYLRRYEASGTIHQAHSVAKGQGVAMTMDGSAGEQYCLKLKANQWGSDGSLYSVSLSGFIPDPGEPNDQRSEAVFWDIHEGPLQGYFWEKTHVSRDRADYVQFTAPLTEEGGMVTFQVSNPASDISICMNLLNHSGGTLLSGQCSPQGEDALLTTALVSGMNYYLKLYTVNNKASLQPYTLSVNYDPGSEQEQGDTGRLVRLHGFVHRQWGVLPVPMTNVPIYVHISGQPAFLLDTTNWLGVFSARILLADGQQVTIWPVMEGTSFEPEEDSIDVDETLRQHRSVFTVIGGQLEQQTPTPDPESTDTPQPPYFDPTDTPTPPSMEVEATTDTSTITATMMPTITSTVIPTIIDTLSPLSDDSTTILGKVWRLFNNSDPAGIAAAEVILTVNGVDQPSVLSSIDGLFMMEVEGIQPGDLLRLRANALQDDFEPLYFEWLAEEGVNRWEYDFYAYWDEIPASESMDQNRIWGTVWDQFGGDVSGLYLNLQIGTSDAIQRIGPTDSDGYFEAMVTIPDRTMVTVWVDAPGYKPSQLMFFHPYEPEDRELIFWKYHGEDIQ